MLVCSRSSPSPSPSMTKRNDASEIKRGYSSPGFIGRKHSLETRKKISEFKKKNPIRYWLGKERVNLRTNGQRGFLGGISFNRKEYIKEYSDRIKNEVFSHYAKGVPICACCGESGIWFLSIDHIIGGGNRERTTLNRRGVSFWRWLRDNGYPSGYQVLCYNCNMAKRDKPKCPHHLPHPQKT